MVGADQFAEVQRDVRDLVAQQPPETEERRRVADDLLGLGHRAVPVRLLLVTVVHGRRGRRRVRPPVADDRGRRGALRYPGP